MYCLCAMRCALVRARAIPPVPQEFDAPAVTTVVGVARRPQVGGAVLDAQVIMLWGLVVYAQHKARRVATATESLVRGYVCGPPGAAHVDVPGAETGPGGGGSGKLVGGARGG